VLTWKHKWSNPEKPELLESPTTDEHSRTGAARRIDRKVRHRNTDQMDQRQAETDGDGCKALRGRVCLSWIGMLRAVLPIL